MYIYMYIYMYIDVHVCAMYIDVCTMNTVHYRARSLHVHVNTYFTFTSFINLCTVGRVSAGQDSQMAAMHFERLR